MRKAIKDLSKREISFIIIIILGLLAVGFLAWRMDQKRSKINSFETCAIAGFPIMESYPEQCAAFGKTYTKLTQTYTDSTGRFSITYPTTLTVVEDLDCCENSVKDWTKESRPFSLKPLSETNEGNQLNIIAGSNSQISKQYKRDWENNGHAIEQVKVGQYDGEYVHEIIDNDKEQYADSNYLVHHFNFTVYMSYREHHHHKTSNINYDSTEYFDDYKQAIDSIKFL